MFLHMSHPKIYIHTCTYKHNHSVNIQRDLHSQLGSSKVFHNWLAFLMLLRALFASQPKKW